MVVNSDAPVALTSDFHGQIVVAWEDWRASGGSSDVYATGYPADNFLSDGDYVRTLDPGGLASWGNITWTATTLPGTGLQLAIRVMTETGASWTNWVMHTTSGEALPHPDGRQIQYRATFTSTAPLNDTAVLDEVIISCQPYPQIYLPLVVRAG